MPYNKFSQLEPDEGREYGDVDKRIMESSPYFTKQYQSIVYLIEAMKDQYFAAGDELGIDPGEVESAWSLVVADLGKDV